MNTERLQLKDLLAKTKKKYRVLDTDASGLVLILRVQLNPYEAILNLDLEKILTIANRLNDVQIELRNTAEKIKKLEAEIE